MLTCELAPGDRVGALRIERELGRGAFGVVYLATDTLIGRSVALKIIFGTGLEVLPEVREQILNEARLIGALNCANVVTLYGLHEAQDGGFMQELEFVAGGTLEDRLGEGMPVFVEEAVRITKGILRALDSAHRANIVHGDVKPENVLFGPEDIVKLADFGVARIVKGNGALASLEGQAVGSPLFMAPEVITGDSTGPASDLWSATVLLYLLLTGSYPFHADSFPELRIAVLADEPPLPEAVLPAGFGDLLKHGLAKIPQDRPADAAAMLSALDRLTAPPGPTNIVPATRPMIGREREAAEVGALLGDDSVRLVTVTGPPGVGKSLFCREVALGLRGRFPGGVKVIDPGGRVETRVRDLIQEVSSGPPGPRLYVLEHPETRVDEVADEVVLYLAKDPGYRFLAAGNSLLEIGGERPYRLGPLTRDAATKLYRSLGGEGAEEVVEEVVETLHRMPLALVAAADAGDTAAGERALRVVVSNGIDRLESWEHWAFKSACALPDEFSLEEAEDAIDLMDFEEAPLVMDVVQSLAVKSLLRARETPDGTRFSMYPFIREAGCG